MKQYLKTGDRVYTTGAFLVWHDNDKSFSFDGIEEDTFFDGEPVNFDDMDRPYITKAKDPKWQCAKCGKKKEDYEAIFCDKCYKKQFKK